jgi:hypothetical protein
MKGNPMAQNKNNSFNLTESDIDDIFEMVKSRILNEPVPEKKHKWLKLAGSIITGTVLLLMAFFLPMEHFVHGALIVLSVWAVLTFYSPEGHRSFRLTRRRSSEKTEEDEQLQQPSENDLKLAAFHEAGHAVCNYYLPHAPEIQRIDLGVEKFSDTYAGGFVYFKAPQNTILSEAALKSMIAVKFGGIMAEKLFRGEISCGSSNDLDSAMQTAYDMAATMGMGKRLGLCTPGHRKNFWHEDLQADIRDIISECSAICEKTLLEHRELVEKLAILLLEKRILDDGEIKTFFQQS